MNADTLKVADLSLAVIGLGYVGLPLAIEFGKKRSVVGFDINQVRVDELKSGRWSFYRQPHLLLSNVSQIHPLGEVLPE